MAATINISPPFVSGADETQAFYIYTDQACTTALDITGRTYRMDIATAPGATPALSLTGSVTGASGLVQITETDPPTPGPDDTAESVVVVVDGLPVRQWTVRPLTGDEIAARDAINATATARAELAAQAAAATTVAKLRAVVIAALDAGTI